MVGDHRFPLLSCISNFMRTNSPTAALKHGKCLRALLDYGRDDGNRDRTPYAQRMVRISGISSKYTASGDTEPINLCKWSAKFSKFVFAVFNLKRDGISNTFAMSGFGKAKLHLNVDYPTCIRCFDCEHEWMRVSDMVEMNGGVIDGWRAGVQSADEEKALQ